MNTLPKIVHQIACNVSIFVDLNHKRNICYTINAKEETETSILVKLPEFERPELSDVIIDDRNEFVNGFKVVQLENEEYAYVRESDHQLLPFRYDVACNFNPYGFAMVGKNGRVSWIDKTFRYLNLKGKMIEEDGFVFDGWNQIQEFSKGRIPLSFLYNGNLSFGRASYFGIDGNIKEFFHYDGTVSESIGSYSFIGGTPFNEFGYATMNDGILLARGYYCTYLEFVEFCNKQGFIQMMCENIEKQNISKKA